MEHFGKKNITSPPKSEQPHSFGTSHAFEPEPDKSMHPEPAMHVKPAREAPPEAKKSGASSFARPPELAKYIRSLDEPESLPTVISIIDKGDTAYRQRMDGLSDILAKEILHNIDVRGLAGESREEMSKTIADCMDIILQHRDLNLTPREKADILQIMISDFVGLGPLDEFLADDRISDIMVDGPNEVYIEMNGRIDRTTVRFRSEEHLLGICQRIVSQVDRHVDKASPICDARLPDGSRVNVILPPLALKGPTLTIRKFRKEKLTLEKLVGLGTVDERTAALLEVMAASRVNMLVIGGTGSGKTTLLNCLTKYISPRERVITCEDTAELQLQQPHVVSLETRIPNTENQGRVSMRDLVRNCMRMRPDRIIVGEVRGGEGFDLLQAMNTGHDGSMSTFHANSPHDALFRLENMVSMANLGISVAAIREQISSSLEVVIHTQRLHDGSRKVMNITEILGLADGVIETRDLVTYEVTDVDQNGRLTGEFKFSRHVPEFMTKARMINLEKALRDIMELPEI